MTPCHPHKCPAGCWDVTALNASLHELPFSLQQTFEVRAAFTPFRGLANRDPERASDLPKAPESRAEVRGLRSPQARASRTLGSDMTTWQSSLPRHGTPALGLLCGLTIASARLRAQALDLDPLGSSRLLPSGSSGTSNKCLNLSGPHSPYL